MTRFLLPLPTAIDLVLYALQHGKSGEIFVRKSPAATTGDLAQACLNIFKSGQKIQDIGIRDGEKMHETLISWEESIAAEDMGEYYRIRADRAESYEKYLSQGHADQIRAAEYTSANTQRLNVQQTQELLLSLKEIQAELC